MKYLSQVLVGVAVLCIFDGARANDIDSYIYGLDYKRDQVLAYKGESMTSVPVEKEGKVDPSKNFIVIKREKKSTQNGLADIGVVTANEHVSYPGALLLANERLIDNAPDTLALPRGNLTYTVNLPGLTNDGSFTIEPSFANYQAAKEKTLKRWFEKYPNDHSVASNFQSDHTFAYSQEYLRVRFGLDFKNAQIESKIDFSAMKNQEKLIMIHKFKQVYYTVSVQPTQKPSDLFASSVTGPMVRQKTNSANPPVIVDSVSYGRTIYVKLETSSTDSEAKAFMSAKITKFDVGTEVEAESKQKLKDLTMQVFVVGGSSDHIELINAQTFKEINDVLVKFARFSRDNLGYPISYSSQFIKDNSRAIVQMSTDYVETTRTVFPKGTIKVVHKGAFVMQWSIWWTEYEYNKYGAKNTKEVSWSKNWQDLTAPFETEIELPGNVESVNVFAREATGLAWEWWRTVIDKKGIPLINMRTFSVWGTTLSPDYSIYPSV